VYLDTHGRACTHVHGEHACTLARHRHRSIVACYHSEDLPVEEAESWHGRSTDVRNGTRRSENGTLTFTCYPLKEGARGSFGPRIGDAPLPQQGPLTCREGFEIRGDPRGSAGTKLVRGIFRSAGLTQLSPTTGSFAHTLSPRVTPTPREDSPSGGELLRSVRSTSSTVGGRSLSVKQRQATA